MYILKIAYDETHCGFQSQPHKNTVCDKIINALNESGYLTNDKIIYYGGRTDKGVSAIGNFIVVELNKKPILSHIYSKLKNKGVWVLGYDEIDNIPKVQYRHYRYILPNISYNGKIYNVESMKKASKKFIGTHSFHNLSKKDKSKKKNPIRTIYNINITRTPNYIVIDIVGKSFLWNMVRKMITVLSDIGLGKRPIDWIDELLDKNNRKGVAPAAAEGLILINAKTNVIYKYDEYVLTKFKKEWLERSLKYTTKMGVSNVMRELNPHK